MPKLKEFYVNLPKLIVRDAIDKLMFGYVMGYRNRRIIPVIEVKKAIEDFKKDFNLSEDEYPLDSAIVTFYNIFKEFKDFRKE